MRQKAEQSLRESATLKSQLIESCLEATMDAVTAIHEAIEHGNKLLLFGNGGSAADAQHIAAELIGRFARGREGLPAIALTTDTSAITSISNDYGFEQVFARQLRALARPGDVAIAISTSGRSPNIIAAAEAARSLGLTLVALTGRDGGSLAPLADIAICVPSDDTARIQEAHITLGHILCDAIETLHVEASEASTEASRPKKNPATASGHK